MGGGGVVGRKFCRNLWVSLLLLHIRRTGQFPAAVDICGLGFLGWEMGAGGLSHLRGCWDGQTVTDFTGEALPALPLCVLGPAGVVGREMTLYVPTAVYPVLGPKLNTVYVVHQTFPAPCKVYRWGN